MVDNKNKNILETIEFPKSLISKYRNSTNSYYETEYIIAFNHEYNFHFHCSFFMINSRCKKDWSLSTWMSDSSPTPNL
jgi:hypothetical protein